MNWNQGMRATDFANIVDRMIRNCRIGGLLARLALAAGGLFYLADAASSGDVACVIKPSAEISIATPVEGLIQTMTVDRGDWVTKDQVLVTLESSLEEATVALAKAKAEAEAALKTSQVKIGFSGRKLERALELSKTTSIARHEVDEAETEKVLAELAYLEAVENRRLAELELQRATTALQLRTIRSPINGVVMDRLLSPGEMTRQTPIMKLAQIDPLYVEVFAPLSWLGKLKPGMPAGIRLDGQHNGVHPATITVVNPVVDPVSGTFGVRLELPNPNNVIPAGLACTAEFQPS
jgi:RND family efflux transporter MFP subunit